MILKCLWMALLPAWSVVGQYWEGGGQYGGGDAPGQYLGLGWVEVGGDYGLDRTWKLEPRQDISFSTNVFYED